VSYNKSMRLPMINRPLKFDKDKIMTKVAEESSSTFHEWITPPRILMKVKPTVKMKTRVRIRTLY
jgi:hypothetical protein